MNINIGLGAQRKTVLLVDSDASMRATLRTALEAGRFSVGEATNCTEAKRAIERAKPDAVIFDIVQDHDVSIVANRAGVVMDLDKPPFFYILTTTNDGLVEALDLQKLGVSGIFLKPLNFPVIVQTLKYRFS